MVLAMPEQVLRVVQEEVAPILVELPATVIPRLQLRLKVVMVDKEVPVAHSFQLVVVVEQVVLDLPAILLAAALAAQEHHRLFQEMP